MTYLRLVHIDKSGNGLVCAIETVVAAVVLVDECADAVWAVVLDALETGMHIRRSGCVECHVVDFYKRDR